MTFKASDNERWLAGMKRMVARARSNGGEAS
jgi:hypothetical protein